MRSVAFLLGGVVGAVLDHANLITTSRYLNVTAQGMHAALKCVEEIPLAWQSRGKQREAGRTGPIDRG